MYETFIGIGIVVSLIYNELTDYSPGGLITPGYFALFIDQPFRLLITYMIALMTFFVVKFITPYLNIHGKRRFASCVIVAMLIKMLLSMAPINIGETSIILSSIGIIIPGLIASDMSKQKVLSTTLSLIVVTSFLGSILWIMKGQI